MANFRKLAPTPQYAVKGTRVVPVDPELKENFENRRPLPGEPDIAGMIRTLLSGSPLMTVGGAKGTNPNKLGNRPQAPPNSYYPSDLDPKYDVDTPMGMQLGRGDVQRAADMDFVEGENRKKLDEISYWTRQLRREQGKIPLPSPPPKSNTDITISDEAEAIHERKMRELAQGEPPSPKEKALLRQGESGIPIGKPDLPVPKPMSIDEAEKQLKRKKVSATQVAGEDLNPPE